MKLQAECRAEMRGVEVVEASRSTVPSSSACSHDEIMFLGAVGMAGATDLDQCEPVPMNHTNSPYRCTTQHVCCFVR